MEKRILVWNSFFLLLQEKVPEFLYDRHLYAVKPLPICFFIKSRLTVKELKYDAGRIILTIYLEKKVLGISIKSVIALPIYVRIVHGAEIPLNSSDQKFRSYKNASERVSHVTMFFYEDSR
jgi:hypothetical protein